VVAGSARTRSTRADPATSGATLPQLFQVCLVGLAAAGRIRPNAPLPTPPNGVILGITAVTVTSSPARRDSSWAYPAMNRWVALDPA
jgi:hypothetical protein